MKTLKHPQQPMKPRSITTPDSIPARRPKPVAALVPAGLALLTCLVVVGCASGNYASEEETIAAGARSYTGQVLCEGDVVSIGFKKNTGLSSTNQIPINGLLDLTFIGPVQAAGKTANELQQALTEAYRTQIQGDVITVQLVKTAASVYVGGAVLRPGKIPLDRPMTVLEAIMEAGGYDPNRAKISSVTVVRIRDGRQTTYRLDLRKAFRGDERSPFYLQPYDTVQVPNRTFNW